MLTDLFAEDVNTVEEGQLDQCQHHWHLGVNAGFCRHVVETLGQMDVLWQMPRSFTLQYMQKAPVVLVKKPL